MKSDAPATTGSATITINRAPDVVFAAVINIGRTGEWSPECVGARWVAPAEGAEVGAQFEGDNVAKIGPITVKKWTTTSEVTEIVPNEVFEFVAAGYTTWRYELREVGGATELTEAFSHPPYEGFQRFLYNTVAKRPTAMVKGIEQTLDRMKQILEAATG